MNVKQTNLIDPAVPDLQLYLERQELLVYVSKPVYVGTENNGTNYMKRYSSLRLQ